MTLARHIFDFRLRREKLERLTLDALAMKSSHPERAEAMIKCVIIEAQDSWSLACRQIVLTSASGRAISRKGQTIARSSSATGGISAIDYLRLNWATKKMGNNWEPDWFIPANAIRAASILGVSNTPQITSGLGAAIVHDYLRAARNVVAHSLPNTWAKLRAIEASISVGTFLAPTEFVTVINPRTGKRFIFVWLEELEICLQWAAD